MSVAWRRVISIALVVAFVVSALQISAGAASASTPVVGPGFGYSSYASVRDDLLGLAFQPSTGALFLTDAGGQLWRVPSGGGAPTPLGGLMAKNPRGITFGLDGKMYVARYDNGSSTGAGDIIEVDPTTGAVLRVVAARGCLDGIATEPGTGDLIITSCWRMWRVVAPASGTPSIVPYALLYNAHAIQISSAGKVFVNAPVNAGSCSLSCTNDRSEIWDVTGGTAQSLRNVPGTNGLALVGIVTSPTGPFPHFVFTNSTDGDVQKVNLDTAGANRLVLGDAGDGDLMTIGPDNCLYAIHGRTVNRIAKSDLTCDLETAGETIPDLELGVDDPTPNVGSPLTLTATLTGLGADPASLSMFFDVAGANAQTGLPGTLIGGSLAVGWAKWKVVYTGTATGGDLITARTTHLSLPVLSAPLPVLWGPPADTTPPVVKVKVTGPHGLIGFSCAALDAFVEIAVAETCGIFTGAPTIEWQVIEADSPATVSGICPTKTLNYPSPATGTPFTCSVGSEGGSTQKTMTLQAAPIAPELTVVAKTASNALYSVGTPTRETVTVEFTCKAAYGPPFMTCSSAGATISGPTVVIPPAPPGGCAAVACLPYTVVKATHTLATDGIFNVSAAVSDATARSASASFGPVVIDRTAPAVTATPSRAPDSNGWYSADVTLAWACDDAGIVATGCTVSTPATQVVSIQGDLIYGRTATDGVGNTGTGTFQVKLDKTPPTISVTATANGVAYTPGTLTRHDVVLTFTCTDNLGGSGVAAGDCPSPQTYSSWQPGVISGLVTDRAGNLSLPATLGAINIDNTPPDIEASATAPNANGWYAGPVVVSFNCSLDAVTCTGPVALSTEGSNVTATGTAIDAAGNVSSVTKVVKIDSTKPDVTSSVTVGELMTDGRYSINATVSVTGSDALSGVASISYYVETEPYIDDSKTALGPAVVTTPLTTVSGTLASALIVAEGRSTISYTAADRAGNGSVVRQRILTIVHTIPTVTTMNLRTLRDGTIEATATVMTSATPVPANLQVIFTTTPVGAGPVTALTNASGIAVATFTRPAGSYQVTATFAQQLPYLTSAATRTATAAAGTSFVIWGGNPGGVQAGQRLQFWGADWSQQIADRTSAAYRAAGSFKGYAQATTPTTFAATTGKSQRQEDDGDYDDKGRKIKDLPTSEFITVLTTSQVATDGRSITGNLVGYAVLRVEPTKSGRYGERAFGVVVATY